MEHHVLIIDDDTELCALLADFLAMEGFEISAVHDGAEAIEHCRGNEYDAIVLDVMLPRVQGFDVLRRLREFCSTPVIMLTARGEDTDRIVGLEMGADDYLPKPCNPRELAARLRAILRRAERNVASPSDVLQLDQLIVRTGDRSVHIGKQSIKLTTAEFNILVVLMQHAGEVVHKEMLCQQALGRALTAYDRSVDVHVSNLRKKLGFSADQDHIKNIRGVGYQLSTHIADSGA
jgi:DNA-binding response OmpR family regulator